jgi:hypothetical protein
MVHAPRVPAGKVDRQATRFHGEVALPTNLQGVHPGQTDIGVQLSWAYVDNTKLFGSASSAAGDGLLLKRTTAGTRKCLKICGTQTSHLPSTEVPGANTCAAIGDVSPNLPSPRSHYTPEAILRL